MTDIILHQGDALEMMQLVPDHSVGLVFADLPYGLTSCDWDKALPMKPLWEEFERILTPTGVVVLTAIEPFAAQLIMSKQSWYRCEWIWDKRRATGFFNAKRHPLRRHEQVLVFSPAKPVYHPQMTPGVPYVSKRSKGGGTEVYSTQKRVETVNLGTRYPQTIVSFDAGPYDQRGYHPTQKLVTMCEYFIKTYSHPGDTVLDPCMGSGSTGIAAVLTGRPFVGIERLQKYFAIASRRIGEAAGRESLHV